MLGVLVIIAGCASETQETGKLGLTKVLCFFCAGTDGQIVGLF